ncbi:MAG: four helix bundle protein [Candidatus Pacebacteria bacterium]|nr:four helix bundle protein [Candidatus Paceibacterota bacterium]
MSNPKSNNIRYRSYKFSLDIINFVKDFPKNKVYLIFTDQLLRSATSIGANLIEAKSASSKKDFSRFYEIALRSCNETIYWLCLLRDGKLITEKKLEPLIKESNEISKMIASSLITIRGKK